MKKVLSILSVLLIFTGISLAQVSFEGNLIAVTLENFGEIQVLDAAQADYYHIDRFSPLIGGNPNEVMDYYNDMDDVEAPALADPPEYGDVELYGVVDNAFSGAPPAYQVAINIYGWNDQPFVIIKYTITNSSGDALDAKVGFEVLPQIDNAYGEEKMEYLETLNAVRIFRTDSSKNIGIKILQPQMTSLTAIEWFSGYNDSDEDLYGYLYYGSIDTEYQSGLDGAVIFPSVDAVPLADGESTVVYVALALGEDLTDLQANLTSAEDTFNTIITFVDDKEFRPTTYSLSQNYPNPFNPSTLIRFSVPERENVKIKVFNTIGQEVAELFNREVEAGSYDLKFNASDLPSGVYFYSIETDNFNMTKKMMLIK